MVALHQSVSGHLGPERLPPHRSAMRRLRDSSVLRPDRRRPAIDAMTTARWLGALTALLLPFTAGQTKPVMPAPVIVVETSKGAFEFETYPAEAPKTVTHIV